jgi:hypothetical protein
MTSRTFTHVGTPCNVCGHSLGWKSPNDDKPILYGIHCPPFGAEGFIDINGKLMKAHRYSGFTIPKGVTFDE